MKKVKYIGTDNPASFIPDKVYDVIETVSVIPKVPFYKIKDELGDTALYPWSDFELVQ